MKFLRTFGIGEERILMQGFCAPGIVKKVDKCWWISVKTTLARICATSDNTIHPHIITFSYHADSREYEGKRFIWIRYHCPQKDETITVYYDPEKPCDYACRAFGPKTVTIKWW